jgi:hypothetical protein
MEERAPAIHQVVAYTDRLEVRGEVRAWPPRRILDVLNNRQTSFLTMHQTSVMPLSRWGTSPPAALETIALNKERLLLVWLVEETKVEAAEFATVYKVPERVVAYLGPFVVQGTMHIVRESTVSQSLDGTRDQFIALTDPSLLCFTVAGLALEGGLVLCLNRGCMMAVHSAP